MGILSDILKGLPITAVQADKIAALEKRLQELEAENRELKKLVKGCPRCRSLNWSVESCEPDQYFGDLGGSSITWRCPDCGLTQRKVE